MNAEQFNARYPVGTPVFAYPGFRPEDASDARRLVTRTRTAAQVSASGHPVVWVEGEGSYIRLTHVDPVSESVWKAARQAEETAAAVAALGALPVPVGDQPQPLDDTRLAEITARTPERAAALTAWLDQFAPVGGQRALENAETVLAEDVPALLAEIQRLKAERHSTNEALSSAAEALRDMRDRLAEQTRYALHLEAAICQCDPNCENGEYLHAADCPVAGVQIEMLGCPGFEGNPVAPSLCAGCHEPRENHDQPGMHHAIRTINPAEEA